MRKGKSKNFDIIIRKRFIILLTIILASFTYVLYSITKVMLFQEKEYERLLGDITYTEVTGTSSPRGRIYDRYYNIIVDNKSLKTITYQKEKDTTELEMIETATIISPHLEVDYHKISDRNKREYYCAKNAFECDKSIKKSEIEKLKQRKLSQNEINEFKLERIPAEQLNFSDEEMKVAYIFYLMNKGYTYEEKIIKSNATDREYAYVSENNEALKGFNTKIDWERVYSVFGSFLVLLTNSEIILSISC